MATYTATVILTKRKKIFQGISEFNRVLIEDTIEKGNEFINFHDVKGHVLIRRSEIRAVSFERTDDTPVAMIDNWVLSIAEDDFGFGDDESEVEDDFEDDEKYKDKPKTLDETFIYLNDSFDAKYQDKVKSGKIDMKEQQFALGTGLRNSWGLWHRSPLAKWFNERGIYRAEDMSRIILESYQRKLRNEPIDLDTQVKNIQDCEVPVYE